MRCVMVDGALLRVTDRFDETPGSDDMRAAAELVAEMRKPPPRFKTRHGQGRRGE